MPSHNNRGRNNTPRGIYEADFERGSGMLAESTLGPTVTRKTEFLAAYALPVYSCELPRIQ
jgi:hypothetical protein